MTNVELQIANRMRKEKSSVFDSIANPKVNFDDTKPIKIRITYRLYHYSIDTSKDGTITLKRVYSDNIETFAIVTDNYNNYLSKVRAFYNNTVDEKTFMKLIKIDYLTPDGISNSVNHVIASQDYLNSMSHFINQVFSFSDNHDEIASEILKDIIYPAINKQSKIKKDSNGKFYVE